MSKGQYEAAATAFEALGSYEDATTLAMYSKACAYCEAGNYDAGIASLQALGAFKDSAMRATYYTARKCADEGAVGEALALYRSIPLFLDSEQRMAAEDEKWKPAYEAAVAEYDAGDYGKALVHFTELKGYRDADDYAEKIRAFAKELSYNGRGRPCICEQGWLRGLHRCNRQGYHRATVGFCVCFQRRPCCCGERWQIRLH